MRPTLETANFHTERGRPQPMEFQKESLPLKEKCLIPTRGPSPEKISEGIQSFRPFPASGSQGALWASHSRCAQKHQFVYLQGECLQKHTPVWKRESSHTHTGTVAATWTVGESQELFLSRDPNIRNKIYKCSQVFIKLRTNRASAVSHSHLTRLNSCLQRFSQFLFSLIFCTVRFHF